MIINYEEAKEPIGWIYHDESDKAMTGLVLLVLKSHSTFVGISTFGIGTSLNYTMKDPYGPHVIKRFYKGDTISFTVEEGDW